MIVSRPPDAGATSTAGASVTPIGIPQRHDLWQRVVLAKAVLGHRSLTEETAALLLRILDGEQIPDLSTDAGTESR